MKTVDSIYDDEQAICRAVRGGGHRELIGGLWEELGRLQFEFLRTQGLKPHHRLLDIGCGCLRGGVKFVAYLDAGNYYGIDASRSLLDSGYEIELPKAGLQRRLPRANLLCSADFEFSAAGCHFDFALAQSVFTHLSFNRIRECLERLAPVMAPGGAFFATFFEAPEDAPVMQDVTHPPAGVVTHASSDPYHYRFSDFQHACKGLPWSLRYIGEWKHPRGQRFLAFIRRTEAVNAPADQATTRALSVEEALALAPGANHYRSFVGPPDRFDFMGASQFSLLFANGMRENHRILDFGCGSLRLGRLLIPFLLPGRYFGIDPNRWLIEDGLDRELGADILRLKRPSFAYNDDLDCTVFGTSFDFIVAQSIFTHCGPTSVRRLLHSFAATLAADGVTLFSYIRATEAGNPQPAEGWHYPDCVAYGDDHIRAFLANAGLVGAAIPWYHPAAQWYLAARSASRLPAPEELCFLSGAVLRDRQFTASRSQPCTGAGAAGLAVEGAPTGHRVVEFVRRLFGLSRTAR